MTSSMSTLSAPVCLTPAHRQVKRPSTRSAFAHKAAARRSLTVVMAEPREDVKLFVTQGSEPDEIVNFDFGHIDGHHTWKKAKAAGIVSGNGYGNFTKALDSSFEQLGGPGFAQTGLVLASIPATFGIIAFGGGTPATSGVGFLTYAAGVCAVYTVLEQLKEMSKLEDEKKEVA